MQQGEAAFNIESVSIIRLFIYISEINKLQVPLKYNSSYYLKLILEYHNGIGKSINLTDKGAV